MYVSSPRQSRIRFSNFPRAPRLRRFTRDTGSPRKFEEGGREGEGEEGNGKEWSNLEYPEYVRFADIVGNLVVTYRGRLKNSGARNSTCR